MSTVEQYVPNSGIVAFHSGARIMGSNEFTLEGLQEVQQMSGPLYNYAVGVIVPAVVLILLFFIWCCCITFSKCCKRLCCAEFTYSQRATSQYKLLAVFAVFSVVSIVAWGVALQGNVAATQGFNQMFAGIGNVSSLADRGLDGLDTTRSRVQALSDLAGVMVVQCTSFGGDAADPNLVQAPFTSALTTIDDILPDARAQVQQYKDEVNFYLEQAKEYLNWREYGTMIVITCIIILLFFFLLITILRITNLHPERMNSKLRCLMITSVTYSYVIFIVGLLLLLVAAIFVALIHVIGTVASDICVPDVDENINRLAYPFIVPNGQYADDPCGDLGSEAMQYICYFQNCGSVNPLQSVLDQVPNVTEIFSQNMPQVNVQEMVATALPNFNLTEIEGYDMETLFTMYNYTALEDPAEVQAFEDLAVCVNTLQEFITMAQTGADSTVGLLLDLVDCEETIHPLYATIVYRGFCNGFADGLYVAYASILTASLFMMLALMVYRLFEFRTLPTAEDVVYADEADGYQQQQLQARPDGGASNSFDFSPPKADASSSRPSDY